MEKQTPPSWSWTPCTLPLRHQIGNNFAIWSLKPTIGLTHPKRDDVDPTVKLLVEFEKSFQHSEELGWNWHKSWNIPSIFLQFDISDPDTKEKLLCPSDFKAHIFAIKPYLTNENNIILCDVGLQGTSQIDIIDGKGTFQGLKFSSTSFNNEGVKFHLVICIYLQITEDSKPKVLKSVISPAIFVDSRKGVRDNEKSLAKDNSLFSYAEPFVPDKFTKRFIKKDPKRKDSGHEDIQNSFEGLFSYLTAPNIRNKIKHPIFLSVRFSACVSLFYNPNKITETDVILTNNQIKISKLEKFAQVLQTLMKNDLTDKATPQEVDLNESAFIMLLDTEGVEDKVKRKKIWELLCPIRCKSLAIAAHKTEIPPYFIELDDVNWMADLYSDSYDDIAASCKEIFNEEEVEDEEASGDKLPPPEIQVISCNLENNHITETQWRKHLDLPENIGDHRKKLKDEQNSLAPPNMLDPSRLGDLQYQNIDRSRNNTRPNTLNLEQNPSFRTPANPNYLNSFQNRMPPFARPSIDAMQFSKFWLSTQALGSQNSSYPQNMQPFTNNINVPLNSFPIVGFGSGIPVTNQMSHRDQSFSEMNGFQGMSLQPMLSRDLNKMMGYSSGVQDSNQEDFTKRESESGLEMVEVKSEENIKEEEEEF